jgi:tRNA(fMet)-specific endonuclease VapC
MIYALDSNVISALLKQNNNIAARYQHEIEQENEFIIPPIVFYEIERGLLAKNLLVIRRAFIEFCENTEIGEFNISVWEKAAQIYADLSKKGKLTGGKFDGDVFIAAYCIVNGYTLITGNKKHFQHITGLSFVDWLM